MGIESLVLAIGYPAMFVGSFVEGPALMILVGFLLRLGYFSLAPAFLLLLAGDLVGDFMWYGIGRFALHRTIARIEKFFGVSGELFEKIQAIFKKHEGKILFGSKLTTGFGFAVFIVMAAGLVKMPLKKFSALVTFGGMIWTAGLMTIGFFFGNIYLQIAKEFRIVFLIILAGIVLLVLYKFGRHMRQFFLKNKF
jgi:membrane-associated protein